jgi:hypothetical protein
MKDPHVESLVYRAESAEDIIYDDPPPVEIDMDKWEGCLENGILTCRMKTHYASISDARKEIESYLRAWEVNVNLKQGKGSIKFVYQNVNVVDLAPQETGRGVVVCGKAVVMGVGTMIASAQISRKNYPSPPKNFIVSPDVETLLGRYEGYLDGKEPLQSMAYFCLTMVERIYGGQQKKGENIRKAAARTMKVDFEVLDTLGKLTSERGDETTARKFSGQPSPLTGTECAWIASVVKELIYRVGEYSGCRDNSTLTQITMADFPSLK